jgi:prolyl-tRNA editing enzyme YbaK/EbsC (Cys-tRNA(Pro) deacylase)
MRRARCDVEEHQIYSALWKWVPPSYYDWPLEQRAACLGAPSTQWLCKALLMDNAKAAPDGGPISSTYPKFVLAVIQYDATLDIRKLTSAIRSLKPVKERLDYSRFDFRVADAADNDRLTGYAYNSVTPFGLLEKVPILLSDAVVPHKFFWMGGGHVHLKLGMAVADFVKATDAIVADISQPRNVGDVDD